MKKRIFKYFLDFTEAQEKWLNDMAAKGMRLTKTHVASYEFESCACGEYEYMVEFIGNKPYSEAKAYKDYLDDMGYDVFSKNINLSYSIGKMRWRPWADGSAQIATIPGGYNKELLIVGKKRDAGLPELHSEPHERAETLRQLKKLYIMTALQLLILPLSLGFMFAMFITQDALNPAFLSIPAALCLMPVLPAQLAMKYARLYKSEKDNTILYDGAKRKKNILSTLFKIFILLLMLAAIAWPIWIGVTNGSMVIRSGSALMLNENSGWDYWNTVYKLRNGHATKKVKLQEGLHRFTLSSETDSGTLSINVSGKDGEKYYRGSPDTPTEFTVKGPAELTIRADFESHSGGFELRWE